MAAILLAGNYKLMSFNLPRNSIHELIYTIPFPLKKIWRPFDGLGIGLPVWTDYQLIHSYNRIPYTNNLNRPWIVTFESIFPRTIGSDSYELKNLLRKRLTSNNCKKLIAISDYAKRKFIRFNKDWQFLNDVLKKLEVIHPNIPIRTWIPKTYDGKKLQLVFIGNDFARKGGVVALRLAKKAKHLGLPITINLVSGMSYGSNVYTDFPNAAQYENDFKLLELNNVVFYKKKSNKEVLQLLADSHLQIMPTLDDTYGFSIIEGFSVATPAITTNVCALPEIVHHDRNGYLIHLDLNKDRNWMYLSRRNSQEYWEILDSTYDNLVKQVLHFILEIINKPEHYEYLSAGAIAQACKVHNSQKTSKLLDNLYSEIISGAT